MSDQLDSEVIGFRQWRVSEHLQLRSSVMPFDWEPGTNTARHLGDNSHIVSMAMPALPHDCPHTDCQCGFYALHKPTFWYGDNSKNPYSAYGSMGSGELIYAAGVISAWGRLQVHREGFRAEHVKVVAIAAPQAKRNAAVARAVALEYGVPTIPQDELERVAGEFGETVPEKLYPTQQQEVDTRVYGPVFGGPGTSGANLTNTLKQVYTGNSYNIPVHAPPQWIMAPMPASLGPVTDNERKQLYAKWRAENEQAKHHHSHLNFLPKRKGGNR